MRNNSCFACFSSRRSDLNFSILDKSGERGKGEPHRDGHRLLILGEWRGLILAEGLKGTGEELPALTAIIS